MSLKDEAAILLSELLRISPERDNQTVSKFIDTIVSISIDEIERKRPWIEHKLGPMAFKDNNISHNSLVAHEITSSEYLNLIKNQKSI